MIKKLSMNFIKDVLGENLSEIKTKEKDLLLNQKIVATSLSNNKINQTIEQNFQSHFYSDNKNKSKLHNLEGLTRAWFDFNSLNKRYNDSKLFEQFCPNNDYKRNIFEIFNSTRCLTLGFNEYVGCKKNIKEILENNVVMLLSPKFIMKVKHL